MQVFQYEHYVIKCWHHYSLWEFCHRLQLGWDFIFILHLHMDLTLSLELDSWIQ